MLFHVFRPYEFTISPCIPFLHVLFLSCKWVFLICRRARCFQTKGQCRILRRGLVEMGLVDSYHSKIERDISSIQDQISPSISFMRKPHKSLSFGITQNWLGFQVCLIFLSQPQFSYGFNKKNLYNSCRTYVVKYQKLSGVLMVTFINIDYT